MKKKLLLLAGLCLALLLNAQNKSATTIVAAGEDPDKILASSSFLFYDYQDATFSSKQGFGKAKMNYNMLTGEMMFINERDTLALANPQDISSIKIGKQEFIYKSKEFMEILQEADNKMVLLRRRIKPAAVKRTGAYGIATSTDAMDQISVFSMERMGNQTTTDISATQIVTYEIVYTFYLQVNNSLYTGATEKNFQKVFSIDKQLISNYINENKLNLKKEEDIIQLFNFCAEKN